MLREWANEETNELIDEALRPPPRYLSADWDDDEAWESFASAMHAENG